MADLNHNEAAQTIKIIGSSLSGTETNSVNADANGNLQVIPPSNGPVVPGTVAIGSNLIGGQFNTVLPILTTAQQSAVQLDSSGRILIAPLTAASVVSVQQTDNVTPTYSASGIAFVVAAAATDVFVIRGSATKIIKITRIEFAVTTTAGSGGLISASWVKRSSANTGGTSSTAVNTPHDSNNPAATALVTLYTANPSALGTNVGTIRSIRAEAYNTSIAPTYTIWSFGDRPGQSIYLRGIGQYLALNFGGATITGNITCVNIEWTEE